MKQEKHSGIMPIYVNITLEDKGKDNKKEAIDFFFFFKYKKNIWNSRSNKNSGNSFSLFQIFKRTKRC